MIRNVLIGLAFLSGIAGFVISMYNLNTKTVYIDMGKVYDEFVLAKELNKNLEVKIKTSKAYADSLYETLRARTQEVKFKKDKTQEDITNLAKLEEELYYKKEKAEKEIQANSTDNNSKIWNQLNQYIHDYGKENKYTFIFGANGQGTIMYADEEKNVTNAVIAYVNNRYNGIIGK